MLKSDQNIGSMTAAELCELMKQCCCKDSGSTNNCDYCCDELTEPFYCAAHPEWNSFCDAFQAMQSNISGAFPINGQPTVLDGAIYAIREMKKIFEDMQGCRLASTNDPNKIAEINKQTHILTEVFNYTGVGGPEGALRRYIDYIAIHYSYNPSETPNVVIQGQIRVDIFDRIMNAIGDAFPNYKLCCKIGYSI